MSSPIQNLRLGWQPGPPDPRTLRLASYLTPDLPVPPTAVNWLKQVSQWPVYRNDRIGDCVVVACAHLVRGWTRYACGTEHVIAEDDVVRAYSDISGYNPATGAGDDGCRSLDAMNYWRKTGVGGRRIVAYVALDHTNLDEVRAATWLFGGSYIAAQMPLAAGDQFDARKTWTTTGGSRGRRGSWGGHALHVGAYGNGGVTVTTWGRIQTATWDWWRSYVVESFAIVSEDWLDRSGGHSPLGFDLPALLADLSSITT